MAINKYHERNAVIYTALQTGGTPATITATDAIKATDVVNNIAYTFDEVAYLGDFQNRDVNLSLQDHTANVEISAFGKVLGTLDPALVAANVPLSALWQSCGGFITIDATGNVNISNANSSLDALTIEFRKQTPNPTNAGTEKVYRTIDAIGFVDLNLEIQKRPELVFKYQGNDVLPADQTIITPNFGNQVGLEAPVIVGGTSGNINNSTITPIGGTGIELCWQKIASSNLFGFDVTKFKVACEEVFEQNKVTSEVTMTVLETELQASNFNPEANIGGRFSFNMVYGLGAGKNFGVDFTEMILSDIQPNTIDNFFFKDLTFKNVGTTSVNMT